MKKLVIIGLLALFVCACTNEGIDQNPAELSIEQGNVDLGNGDKSKEKDEDELL